MSSIKKYSYTLFKKHSNVQLAKIYGVSREWIRRIRIKNKWSPYKPPCINTLRKKTLLNYLVNNKNNVKIIDIKNLGITTIDKFTVSKKIISTFAKENKIKITFISSKKFEHGYYGNQCGCKCDICKLARTIYQRFRKKIINNRSYHITSLDASRFANKYVNKYKYDKSIKKRNFYSFITKLIDSERTVRKNAKK